MYSGFREIAMRLLVFPIACLLFIALFTSEVSSKPHKPGAKRYIRYKAPYVRPELTYPRSNGWYEHDANKLPIGSTIWWDQMVREGRARR